MRLKVSACPRSFRERPRGAAVGSSAASVPFQPVDDFHIRMKLNEMSKCQLHSRDDSHSPTRLQRWLSTGGSEILSKRFTLWHLHNSSVGLPQWHSPVHGIGRQWHSPVQFWL